MALDARVDLLVAALDLKLVRLLRDAIRTTAVAGGRGEAVAGLGPAPNSANIALRRRIEPEPVIEPRRRIVPTPWFEPRMVIRPRPGVEEPPAAVCPPCEPEKARIGKSFIVPPWKILPWERPPEPIVRIKIIRRKPDIVTKGSLIDCFI